MALLTEERVRQMSNNGTRGPVVVARGDVLTPSARSFLREHRVDVVVLTIPQSVAQDTANRLIELGVRGFWNFTNVELTSGSADVKFENIHFADSLLTLSYRIANR